MFENRKKEKHRNKKDPRTALVRREGFWVFVKILSMIWALCPLYPKLVRFLRLIFLLHEPEFQR